MTAKLIFKMEFFKFRKDKGMMLTAIILGVLNILGMLYIISDAYMYSDMVYGMGIVSYITLSIFISYIFIIAYPFSAISTDYKNNVLSTMFASGVNRTQLFFVKIISVITNTLILLAMTSLVPFILLMLKLVREDAFNYFMDGFFDFFSYFTPFEVFLSIIWLIVAYLLLVVTAVAATVVSKGGRHSFLIFIGFGIAMNVINSFVNMFQRAFYLDYGVPNMLISIFVNAIYMAVLCVVALKTMERQDL